MDDYLDREDLDASLEDLRTHRLAFTKQTGRIDNMARNVTDNVDDYVVVRRRLGSLPNLWLGTGPGPSGSASYAKAWVPCNFLWSSQFLTDLI